MTQSTRAPTDYLSALTKATAGLLWHSESDAPLTPYRWPAFAGATPSPEALLRALGKAPDTPVATETLSDLFEPFTTPQATWNDDDRSEAARYAALARLLEEGLDHVRVYRVGEVDIDVIVLGQHRSGDWVGLRTHVVET